MTFAPNIVPICLPSKDEDFGGGEGWTTGWGFTMQSFMSPKLLREANVPLKTTEECEQEFTEVYDFFMTNDTFGSFQDRFPEDEGTRMETIQRLTKCFLCTSRFDERSSCHGDSGGPLAVQRNDERFVLAGVTSFGDPGCAHNGGYYTKVSAFTDWIQSVIN